MYLITKSELDLQLGITTSTTQATSLINKAENLIHSYIKVDTLEGKEITEIRDFEGSGEYFLYKNQVKGIKTINGNALTYTPKIKGKKVLKLNSNELIYGDDDNEVTIIYYNGFKDADVNYFPIPQDLKDVCLTLSTIIYSKENVVIPGGNTNVNNLKKYTIGDLTEEYDVSSSKNNSNTEIGGETETIYNKEDIMGVLNKYCNVNIFIG